MNATRQTNTITSIMPKRKRGMSAKEFRAVLTAAELSQSQAAKELGVSLRTVNRWACGKGTISVAMAQLIIAKFTRNS
jgi:transcriptional regulator with XRE-family HTH domain